jgi:hypothetical protein
MPSIAFFTGIKNTIGQEINRFRQCNCFSQPGNNAASVNAHKGHPADGRNARGIRTHARQLFARSLDVNRHATAITSEVPDFRHAETDDNILPSSSNLNGTASTASAAKKASTRSRQKWAFSPELRKQMKEKFLLTYRNMPDDILLPTHEFTAAILSALYEICKANHLSLNPLDPDVDLDSKLSEAIAIARQTTTSFVSLPTYEGFCPKAHETFKTLHEDFDANPHLNSIQPSQRWRLMIDQKKIAKVEDTLNTLGIDSQDNFLLAFLFDNEPRYLHDMTMAMKEATGNLDRQVDVNTILSLHAACMGKDVSGFTADPVWFQMTGETLTFDGDDEISAFVADTNELAATMGGELNLYAAVSINAWNGEETGLSMGRASADPKLLQNIVTKWIYDYHHKQNEITEQEVKKSPQYARKLSMFNAIDLCQKLERLHPFEDGNCRTFYLLLIRLLLQQKLPPFLLEDPNSLDGFSRAELFNHVILGIDKFNALRSDVAASQSNQYLWLNPDNGEKFLYLNRYFYPVLDEAHSDYSEPTCHDNDAYHDLEIPDNKDDWLNR